jgi:phosphate:Na+ symporter
VNLLVLAFVGARILQMKHALAVILGSNLGSTVYNWMVVYIGFKFDVQAFALPILAIGAIGLIFFREHKRVMHWTMLGFGLSLLFVGLSFIKTGMEGIVLNFDLSQLNEYSNFVFIIAGFIFTAIVQSSSTIVVVSLSALNSGVIAFEAAACLVIGSETGTAIKTVIGSAGSDADKKRVALGNILINIVGSMVGWIFLTPLTALITETAGINDPLIALVTFQTAINVIGIIIFYPLLNPFAGWLQGRYAEPVAKLASYINKLLLHDPEVAIKATEQDCLRLARHLVWINRKALEMEQPGTEDLMQQVSGKSYSESYDLIKLLNGEILDFCIELKSYPLDESELYRVNALIELLQKTMNSAKSVKDIRHNIKNYRDSADDTLHGIYKTLRKREEPFYIRCLELIDSENVLPNELNDLLYQAHRDHDTSVQEIFRLSSANRLHDLDMATLINVFEAVRSSHESLVQAIRILKGVAQVA